MKSLTVKLSPELDTKLAAVARRRQTTKSDVARQALEAYLNGGGPSKQGTLLELAADLIGSLDGPGDLSHNRRYLDDLGQ